MWITEEAFERGQGVDHVIRTFLFAVFASIHTSSNVSCSRSSYRYECSKEARTDVHACFVLCCSGPRAHRGSP